MRVPITAKEYALIRDRATSGIENLRRMRSLPEGADYSQDTKQLCQLIEYYHEVFRTVGNYNGKESSGRDAAKLAKRALWGG